MKTILALILLAMLSACGSEYASPFEKPESATTQPVSCAASANCG